jgi:hypothetical protein
LKVSLGHVYHLITISPRRHRARIDSLRIA